MDYVKKKIEETNEIALKLGLDKCTSFEQKMFKNMLHQIAVAAVDDTRQQIGDLMSRQSCKYIESDRK